MYLFVLYIYILLFFFHYRISSIVVSLLPSSLSNYLFLKIFFPLKDICGFSHAVKTSSLSVFLMCIMIDRAHVDNQLKRFTDGNQNPDVYTLQCRISVHFGSEDHIHVAKYIYLEK